MLEMTSRVSRETTLTVSRETKDRLLVLAELVAKWNATINLVAPSNVVTLWERHIEDSLGLAPFLNGEPRAADLGSGAGFPGLVLAVATPTFFTLIEADVRKAAFLREAIRATQARAEVHHGRVEDCRGVRFPLITARAFAPLGRLITLSRHLLDDGGRYLLLKGIKVEAEIAATGSTCDFDVTMQPIGSRGGAVLQLRARAGASP